MGTRNRYEGVFDDSTINLIHSKARELVSYAGFSSTDLEDIEQELALHVLDRLRLFNQEKSQLNTYLFNVLNQRLIMMLRANYSLKRDIRKTVSLDDAISPDSINNDAILETTDNEDFLLLTGVIPLSMENHLILQIDIANFIDTLPENLQDTCRLLMERTVTDTARELGIHRDTVYKRLKDIRNHFIDRMLGGHRDGSFYRNDSSDV